MGHNKMLGRMTYMAVFSLRIDTRRWILKSRNILNFFTFIFQCSMKDYIESPKLVLAWR